MPRRKEPPKPEFLQMMRRPSMSELKEPVFRVQRRNDIIFERQNSSVEKIAKVQMTDHMKKQKDFKKVQMRKFSAGDVPALVKARSSLSSSSSLDLRNIDDVHKENSAAENDGQQRGSISTFAAFFFHRNSLQNQQTAPKPPERRRSVWADLSGPKESNRAVAIRQRLYKEFNMGQKRSSHRPWSPCYYSESADSDIQGTEQKRRQSVAMIQEREGSRRMSAPAYLKPLSDKLSPEMEERMAYITGKAPRSSVVSSTTENSVEGDENTDTDLFSLIDQSEATENYIQDTEGGDKERMLTRRRHSQAMESSVVVEMLPQRRRKMSEYSLNRAGTSILPPLVEKT